MRHQPRLTFAAATAPLSSSTVPSSCFTSAACVSTVCVRNRILREQRLVAREIDARIGQQRLVAFQRALGLHDDGPIGRGIDLGDDLAGLNLAAFRNVDAQKLAADLRENRHAGPGLGGAERGDRDGNVCNRGLGDGHGNLMGFCRWRRGRAEEKYPDERQHQNEREADKKHLPTGGGRSPPLGHDGSGPDVIKGAAQSSIHGRYSWALNYTPTRRRRFSG